MLIFLGNFAVIVGLNRRNNRRNYSIMGKKCFVIALAVFAFGFGSALRSNAGTDMIEPYRAPAPSLQLRAATAAAPCRICSASSLRRRRRSSALAGYYGRGFGFYGGHRFYGRHAYWGGHRRHWH